MWSSSSPGCWSASSNAGIAFFFSVPIGLTAWWYGRRAALAVALICAALFAVGDLIHPVSEFAVALALRTAFFLAVAMLVSWAGERLVTLEHSAEELEAIRAALAPAELPDLKGVERGGGVRSLRTRRLR